MKKVKCDLLDSIKMTIKGKTIDATPFLEFGNSSKLVTATVYLKSGKDDVGYLKVKIDGSYKMESDLSNIDKKIINVKIGKIDIIGNNLDTEFENMGNDILNDLRVSLNKDTRFMRHLKTYIKTRLN